MPSFVLTFLITSSLSSNVLWFFSTFTRQKWYAVLGLPFIVFLTQSQGHSFAPSERQQWSTLDEALSGFINIGLLPRAPFFRGVSIGAFHKYSMVGMDVEHIGATQVIQFIGQFFIVVIKATMIYTHIKQKAAKSIVSPLDTLVQNSIPLKKIEKK